MTVRTLLVRPLVWALVRTDALVLFFTLVLVALTLGQALLGLGLSSFAAILSALPVAIAAALGACLWWVSPGPGRRACMDAALETADRLADWAGWPTVELDS
ncbi:hypothetical protein [Streptomyces sp. bgisy060]|uniref:hypothetical protein n=1 Tax=Streptomyces sp. bgisy060 TaxID=3413775 RepID=UPI003EB94066